MLFTFTCLLLLIEEYMIFQHYQSQGLNSQILRYALKNALRTCVTWIIKRYNYGAWNQIIFMCPDSHGRTVWWPWITWKNCMSGLTHMEELHECPDWVWRTVCVPWLTWRNCINVLTLGRGTVWVSELTWRNYINVLTQVEELYECPDFAWRNCMDVLIEFEKLNVCFDSHERTAWMTWLR